MDGGGDRGAEVATIVGASICQYWDDQMTRRDSKALIAGPEQRRPAVRVKLRRINAGYSKPFPPDGEGKIWWARPKKSLGASSDFVNASLLQLQAAAQLHCGGISELP
jgi:hypothetical protein